MEELTREQLVERVTALEVELKKEKESSNHWYEERNKIEERFNTLKDGVMGIASLVTLIK